MSSPTLHDDPARPRSVWDIVVWCVGGVLVVWTLVAMAWSLDRSATFGRKSDLEVARIKEGSGKAWRYAPTPSQAADNARWMSAVILENGRPLPHQNVERDDVIQWGQGYALTPKNLWFATSDGSDPRSNGRKYQVAFPVVLPQAWQVPVHRAWAWLGLTWVLLLARRQIAAGTRIAARSHFWRFVVLVAVVRVVLVSCDEIMVTPSDELEYVILADNWYYNAPGAAAYFYRLPVYPLFLALSSTTGLPLRLVIELVQMASYALLAGAMLRCRVSPWAAFGAFAWMALSPQTAAWNNYTITDTLYPPLLFGAIAFGLFWAMSQRGEYAATTGLLLGLAMNLREERIVAIGLAFLFVSIAVLKHLRERWATRFSFAGLWRGFRPLVLSTVLLAGVCGIVDVAFQALFFSRTGVWAHCLLSTPGLNAFMNSMYRIPPQGPLREHFLIDKKVRDFASSLSPTFRERQHFYEEEDIGWREMAKETSGVYDLDTSSFVWCTILQDVFADGPNRDSAYRDRLMKKAAQEIKEGLAGHPQQTIFLGGTFPLNTAAVTLLIHNFWPLTLECMKYYTFAAPIVGTFGTEGRSEDSIAIYNSVTHRRPSLAAIADTTGNFRPPWIMESWTLLFKIEMACLWLALAAAAAALVMAALKLPALWRRPSAVPWPNLAMLTLLAFIAATRLAFGILVLIYYGSHVRYMIPFVLVSLPALLILIDLLVSWIHQTGRTSPVPAPAS